MDADSDTLENMSTMHTKNTDKRLDSSAPTAPRSVVNVPLDVRVTDTGVELSSSDPNLRISTAFVTYMFDKKDINKSIRISVPTEADDYMIALVPSDANAMILPVDFTLEVTIQVEPKAKKPKFPPYPFTIRTRQNGGGRE